MERIIASAVLGLFVVAATTPTARADFLYASKTNNLIVSFNTAAAGSPTPTTFTTVQQPGGLAFDATGNLYVATFYTGVIEKYTPGGVGSVFATNPNLATPLAIDAKGNVYVAGTVPAAFGTDGVVYKYTPNGVGSVFADVGNEYTPLALKFDATGNLYVTVNSGHVVTIDKFAPNGVLSAGPNVGPYYEPVSVAFDSGGNTYVGTYPLSGVTFTGSIAKFTPGGVTSVFATLLSYDPPRSMAFDSVGNLYVATDHDIEKFTPNGVGSVFAGDPTNFFNSLAFQPPPVPEPSAFVLAGIGVLVGLGMNRRTP